jgi:hypothetical protein
MREYRFYITTDQIDGLARLREEYGDRMAQLVFGQWVVDHGMIPTEEVEWEDDFTYNKSGILVPARIFYQEHNHFELY